MAADAEREGVGALRPPAAAAAGCGECGLYSTFRLSRFCGIETIFSLRKMKVTLDFMPKMY